MPRIEYKNILTEKERDKIYQEVWQENIKDVAYKRGVSGNTLRNWCQLTAIPYPRRGELKAHLEGELQRPKLLPVTREVRKYVAPFRIQFQEEELTQESIEEMEEYVDRLCAIKIYHSQTDLFGERKEEIHSMIIKQLDLHIKVFEEVYSNLCRRLKEIRPLYEIDEEVVDMDVFKYFFQIGQPFIQRLKGIILEMPSDRKKVEEMGLERREAEKKIEGIYVSKMTQSVDTLHNEDIVIINHLQGIAYQNALTKMFGPDYHEYYYSYYNFKTIEEWNKIADVMTINDLVPIITQGGNLDRSARITNVILKVLEVYAPNGVILVHPYNVFVYTEKITKYYENDYRTYIKVGEIILGLRLQRDQEGMCLSIKLIEGKRLDKKIKTQITATDIIVRDTESKSIETQLKDMLVVLLETINNFAGQRSKCYKSSGIEAVYSKKG